MDDITIQRAINILEHKLRAEGFELAAPANKDFTYLQFLIMIMVQVETQRLMSTSQA